MPAPARALLASLALLVFASTSNAARAGKWYWSQSKAEALVAAKVHIPMCQIDRYATGPTCNNPKPHQPGFAVGSATCEGADERGSSFAYARFSCAITVVDGYGRAIAKGRILVYPSGPTLFRWKIE